MGLSFKKGSWNSPIAAKIAAILYIGMLIFTIIIGYYLLTITIFIIAFLFLIVNLKNLRIFRYLSERPMNQKLLYIFSIALLLRFLLLFQDQIITRDIELYVDRSAWMLTGQIPYEDFAVNKPPLYAYMLQLLGLGLGVGEVQFRALFSVMDGVVAVLIYYLGLAKFDEQFSFKAAIAYVLCPIPIIAVGLAGHYEPIVMLFVLLAFLMFFKNRCNLSAFFLGIGFALKFFPIVLVPFFLWKIDTWRKRILYFITFSIPIILSIIPILFISSSEFYNYMYMQSFAWEAKKSFAFALELIIGSKYMFGFKFTLLFQLLFLGLIFAMFVSWVRKTFKASFWFKLVIIIFAIYYGLFTTASFKFYQTELSITDPIPVMAIFALVYFTIIILLIHKFWHILEVKTEPKDELYILSAFSLIFLLFSSSQYNPWYILWPLPFILLIKNSRIKFLLLWLIFWSYEGIGISLLPGFALV